MKKMALALSLAIFGAATAHAQEDPLKGTLGAGAGAAIGGVTPESRAALLNKNKTELELQVRAFEEKFFQTPINIIEKGRTLWDTNDIERRANKYSVPTGDIPWSDGFCVYNINRQTEIMSYNSMQHVIDEIYVGFWKEENFKQDVTYQLQGEDSKKMQNFMHDIRIGLLAKILEIAQHDKQRRALMRKETCIMLHMLDNNLIDDRRRPDYESTLNLEETFLRMSIERDDYYLFVISKILEFPRQ